MKKQSPHLEDGAQPDYVRELLDAGRGDAAAGGYDVESGLSRHLAQVQAGTPLPPWAHDLIAASGGGAAAAAGVTAAKIATGKLVAGVVLAVIAAGTIAAIVIGAPENSAHMAPYAPGSQTPPAKLPTDSSAIRGEPSSDERAGAEANEAVELELPPITSSRPRRTGHAPSNATAQTERDVDGDSKQAPSRANSAKSIEALIEAVGKPGGSSTRPASKGHVDLVAPTGSAERARDQASQPSERAEQTSAGLIPTPVADDARLEREMGMLAVAQKVLKSDPERALRLARQGEQEFAGSMFTQERQQVLLLALIELGRISEAKRLAQPYLKRYPNGPYSDRVRSALAAAKPEN
jgi:hypothetical protein